MVAHDRERRLPPVVADLPGHVLKPDPLTAGTMQELEALLHVFWLWSGSPSTRKIADGSEGVFCHSTVAKLVKLEAKRPSLSFDYLCGFIRGCGGDSGEVQLWAAAWRRIHLATQPSRNSTTNGGEAR